MKTLRILIADDHDVVREGLRRLLGQQPSWEVCGEAVDGREAVEMAAALRPDVVVLDFSMPELNGLEATQRIRAILPETEILLLTMHDSEQIARSVLRAGARGVLIKTDARRLLLPAVDAVSRHEAFLDPTLPAELLGSSRPAVREVGPAEPVHRLTPREREVVRLVAAGKSSKEVAAELGISVRTVDSHRANLMRKLGLRSLGELVLFAVRHRIVQP